MSFDSWIGKTVTYVSRSGAKYVAKITAIPLNPNHGYTDLPTVSLEFRDQRGKLVRKPRVLPTGSTWNRAIWISE